MTQASDEHRVGRWSQLAAAATLICLAFPAASSAAAWPEGRAVPARVLEQVRIAEAFWDERGMGGCPGGVRVLESSWLPVPDRAGVAGGCRVWLLERFVRTPWRPRVPALAYECAVVVHEVAHARGYWMDGHASSGVMTEEVSEVPAECETWAKTRTRATRLRALFQRFP